MVRAFNDDRRRCFGGNLSAGELDWVQWRINWFLGHHLEQDAPRISASGNARKASPLEGVPEQSLPRPEGISVEIEEDQFASRIRFPNTSELGTYTGISTILFGGCVLSAALYYTVQLWMHQDAGPNNVDAIRVAASLLGGFFAVLGFAGLLNGLSRIFGRRVLIISPDKVTYRVSLFGLRMSLSLPTDEITSVWKPRAPSGRRVRRPVAAAQGGVIRTSSKELKMHALKDALQNHDDAVWLSTAIARRIHAAKALRHSEVN